MPSWTAWAACAFCARSAEPTRARPIPCRRSIRWPHASSALNNGLIDETAFIQDLDRAFDDRAETILSRVDAGRWNLLVGVVDATDRAQHLLWHLIDPEHPMYDPERARLYGGTIRRMYERADDLTGQVLARVPPDTEVLVLSAHGFHTFRWQVHLNTWLIQHGYLTLTGSVSHIEQALDTIGNAEMFWARVDWSRTKAYAMGSGQIYINRAALDAEGSDDTYDTLVARLATELAALRDPVSGRSVVRQVHKRPPLQGYGIERRPDLQIGLEKGYRVSWQTMFGGAPANVIEPNLQRWSGDHASAAADVTAGVLISSVRPTTPTTRLVDIAPTVLHYFGVAIPHDMDGHALFERRDDTPAVEPPKP
jgi:predicted AlkP superfamily phosphohydrolase/phosphomutase